MSGGVGFVVRVRRNQSNRVSVLKQIGLHLITKLEVKLRKQLVHESTAFGMCVHAGSACLVHGGAKFGGHVANICFFEWRK